MTVTPHDPFFYFFKENEILIIRIEKMEKNMSQTLAFLVFIFLLLCFLLNFLQ